MDLDSLKSKLVGIDKKLSLKSPHQLVNDWVQNELDIKKNPMTTGFEEFDKTLRSNLKGKLGIFAGYGGSKKSYLLLIYLAIMLLTTKENLFILQWKCQAQTFLIE